MVSKNRTAGSASRCCLASPCFMNAMLSRILRVALSYSTRRLDDCAGCRRHSAGIFTVLRRGSQQAGLPFTGRQVPVRRHDPYPARCGSQHLLQIPALSLTIAVAAVGIFSVYILYDIQPHHVAAKPTASAPRWRSHLDIYRFRQPAAADHGLSPANATGAGLPRNHRGGCGCRGFRSRSREAPGAF